MNHLHEAMTARREDVLREQAPWLCQDCIDDMLSTFDALDAIRPATSWDEWSEHYKDHLSKSEGRVTPCGCCAHGDLGNAELYVTSDYSRPSGWPGTESWRTACAQCGADLPDLAGSNG